VGYLVLGAADQVASAPRSVGAEDLVLSDDGVVRVTGGRAARAEDAERDLRSVLDALLFCASSASPGLLRASRRPPGVGLEALVRELETALIPVNRSAAKRALARLQRETLRALETGRIRPDSVPPTARAVQPAVPAVPPPLASAPVVPPMPASVMAAAPPVGEGTHGEGTQPSAELDGAVIERAVTPSVHTAVTTVPPPLTVRPPRVSIPPAPKLPQAFDAAVERTVVLAAVAPRPAGAEQASDSQLVETRPEPVVRRASAHPPAPAAEALGTFGRTEPLPPVVTRAEAFEAVPVTNETSLAAENAGVSVTPLLGTRVTEEAPDSLTASFDAALEVFPEVVEEDIFLEPLAGVDEAPGEIEEASGKIEEAPSEIEDFEIVVLDPRGFVTASDETSVPIAVAAAPEPAAVEAHVAAEPMAVEAHVAVEPMATPAEVSPGEFGELPPADEVGDMASDPVADETSVDAPAEPLELAVLVESALAPWVREPVTPVELTPPPRVARPEPRPSDVEDLLRRLDEVPLPEEDVATKLRRLAGLDATPPPSTTDSDR
jgi:hypothetical protein